MGAGTDASEVIVAVDAGGMSVRKTDLNGVVPHLRGGVCARLGLKHGQDGRGGETGRERLECLFFAALVAAGGAGAFLAQVGKIKVAGVAVCPGNIHARAARDMNFDARWLLTLVDGSRHGLERRLALRLSIAAIAGGNGIPVGAGRRMPKKCADALIQLRADNVFESASLRVSLRLVNRKGVLKQAFGQAMAAHHVAGALAPPKSKLCFSISQRDQLQTRHS